MIVEKQVQSLQLSWKKLAPDLSPQLPYSDHPLLSPPQLAACCVPAKAYSEVLMRCVYVCVPGIVLGSKVPRIDCFVLFEIKSCGEAINPCYFTTLTEYLFKLF